MADRSRDLTTGCFAASNSSGRPSRQVSTTKRNLVAHLPWAHTTLDSNNSVHHLYRIGLRIVTSGPFCRSMSLARKTEIH